MRESEIRGVRKCAWSMVRDYENALQYSLDISLTKHHCASIDEKSHRIEVLRPRLEKRIADLRRQKFRAVRHATQADHDFGHRVPVFLDHCRRASSTAAIMRKVNAELMRRSHFQRVLSMRFLQSTLPN